MRQLVDWYYCMDQAISKRLFHKYIIHVQGNGISLVRIYLNDKCFPRCQYHRCFFRLNKGHTQPRLRNINKYIQIVFFFSFQLRIGTSENKCQLKYLFILRNAVVIPYIGNDLQGIKIISYPCHFCFRSIHSPVCFHIFPVPGSKTVLGNHTGMGIHIAGKAG